MPFSTRASWFTRLRWRVGWFIASWPYRHEPNIHDMERQVRMALYPERRP